MSKLFLPAVMLCLLPTASLAQTNYVTDELQVNLRAGPGIQYRIEKVLKSGDAVTVEASSQGWSRVTGPDGQSGWLLERMLVAEEPAELRAQRLAAELKQMEAETSDRRSELKLLRENSKDAVRAVTENRDFREKLLSLESEVQALRHENQGLRGRHAGMKIGAVIMVFGVIVGMVLPMLRRRNAGNSHWT